ncbi:VBA5 Vacuolar basic amino acid transporter 5 [Candida maltosa Xu316]|uniref:Major facilitator superfamily (MFS) profile domain-containing protein n=1 Tax=Candida maltosa (strain Xu316) TaxID=1245528 RepID=M3IUR0_CANMX|nr:hypothetical protein G210_4603 [Candida maltosa Xu316]
MTEPQPKVKPKRHPYLRPPSFQNPLNHLVRLSANLSEIKLPYLDDTSTNHSTSEKVPFPTTTNDSRSNYNNDINSSRYSNDINHGHDDDDDDIGSYYENDEGGYQTGENESISASTLAMSTNDARSRSNSKTLKSKKYYYEADAGDGTHSTDQYVTGFRLALTLFSCIVSLFLVVLDQTIVTTIISDVGNLFESFDKIGWLTSGYLLPMACLSLLNSKIVIAFGRKNCLLAGILIFEIGSLVAALAKNMPMLIGGRVIQGLGGGTIQSIISIILTESVPISKRSLSYALLGITYSCSFLGPIVGAAILSHLNWRWCFWINLPIGGAAFVILMIGFNPPKVTGNVKERLSKIDYMGTFLLTTGLVLILLALSFGGEEYKWKSGYIIQNFIVGGFSLIAFVIWTFKYSPNPMILSIFIKKFTILCACIASFTNFAVFIALITYLATYFQVVFNKSAFKSSIAILPMIVSVVVASMLNGPFIRRTRNVKASMLLSGILAPIGTALLLLLDRKSSTSAQIGLQICIGASIGLQFQASLLSSQLEVPKDIEGSLIMITVFLSFLKSLGGTLSVSFAQLVYNTSVNLKFKSFLNNLDPTSIQYQTLSKFEAKEIVSTPDVLWNDIPDGTIRDLVLDKVIMYALRNVFYMALAFACICTLASFWTTNKKVPKDKDVAHNEEEKEEGGLERTPSKLKRTSSVLSRYSATTIMSNSTMHASMHYLNDESSNTEIISKYATAHESSSRISRPSKAPTIHDNISMPERQSPTLPPKDRFTEYTKPNFKSQNTTSSPRYNASFNSPVPKSK